MASASYEGPPLDGTVTYLSEVDFDEIEEKTEAPSDESYEGSEQVTNSDENDSTLECPECGLKSVYARETKDPKYRCGQCKSEFSETMLMMNQSDEFEETESEKDDIEESESEESSVSPTTNNEDLYSQSEIKHNILKPIVFAKQFADGDEKNWLEDFEDLVRLMIDEGDV